MYNADVLKLSFPRQHSMTEILFQKINFVTRISGSIFYNIDRKIHQKINMRYLDFGDIKITT